MIDKCGRPAHSRFRWRSTEYLSCWIAWYGGVLGRDALFPGATCGVIGVGGLRHMAVQILAAITGARVVAVDVRAEALKLAAQIGAYEALLADENAAKHIRSLVGPSGGADVKLDFVRPIQPFRWGLPSWQLAVGSSWLLAGGHLRVAPGVADTGIPFETRVVIPFWGPKRNSRKLFLSPVRAGSPQTWNGVHRPTRSRI